MKKKQPSVPGIHKSEVVLLGEWVQNLNKSTFQRKKISSSIKWL